MARNFIPPGEYLENTSPIVTVAPLTMAGWARTPSATANSLVMGVGDSTDENDAFELTMQGGTTDDPIGWKARRSTSGSALTTTGYTVNTWHHVCGVETAIDDRAVFIDGGSKGTNTDSKVPVDLDVTRFGVRPRLTADNFMDGDLAFLAIWSAALTDEEVVALAAGISPLRIRLTSLLGFWPLFGSSSEADYYKGDFPMTLVGTPTISEPPRLSPPFGFRRYRSLGPAAPPAPPWPPAHSPGPPLKVERAPMPWV